MPAADVRVYGKEVISGIVVSTPPHLRKPGEDKLPPVNEMLVDVGLGYTLDELKELIPIGSPVGFTPLYSELLGGKISAVDVAMMMALLKIARIAAGSDKEDSFVDLAGYAACAAEIAEHTQGGTYET
jgi:putative aminopeptidase FrvX